MFSATGAPSQSMVAVHHEGWKTNKGPRWYWI